MNDVNASMVNKVCKIINSLSDSINLFSDDIDKNISEYGIDSIGFIRLVIKLEEEFNITIPDEYLILSKMSTIKDICKVLKNCTVMQ